MVYDQLKTEQADQQFGPWGSYQRSRLPKGSFEGLRGTPAAHTLYTLAGQYDEACFKLNRALSAGKCPKGSYEEAAQMQTAAQEDFVVACALVLDSYGRERVLAEAIEQCRHHLGAMIIKAQQLEKYHNQTLAR